MHQINSFIIYHYFIAIFKYLFIYFFDCAES